MLRGFELVRINDRILRIAGAMLPFELRSLDAIHLATASVLGDDLTGVCTYDERMASAAVRLGFLVATPTGD